MPDAAGDAFKLENLRTVKQMVAEHPHLFLKHTLREQLRDRDRNGLAACCTRLGRRVLISVPLYEAWLASRAGVSA